ncbi:DUF2203 domain-containing protein [Candidatus Woesearchaeota archaeon]|nr:DUF2203 domain-containing protein [Candidatus Woesearchaeota archaeon]
MLRKYYTLEQAQQQIPVVEKYVRRLKRLKNSLDVLDSIEISCKNCGFDHFQNSTHFNRRYHKLSYEFYKHLEKLEGMGCVVKDLDLGLLDFLAYHDGREVFLCWKLGENEIKHWHELNSGFSGRKPIWLLTQRRKDQIEEQ